LNRIYWVFLNKRRHEDCCRSTKAPWKSEVKVGGLLIPRKIGEEMRISKLMTRRLFTVSPEDTVETAVQHLRQRGVRHLLVLDGDELVGILSDRDLKRALQPEQTKKKKVLGLGGLFFLLEPILVREIMTRDPLTIDPETTAQEAATLMIKNKFGALPVAKNGRLLGILTETDLLRFIAKMPEKPVRKRTAAR
jgi:acetoin utilization protein AcuB